MEPILKGDSIEITTADGQLLARRAVTGIQKGSDFLVVLVCKEEEWNSARSEGRDAVGIPWPADAVRVMSH